MFKKFGAQIEGFFQGELTVVFLLLVVIVTPGIALAEISRSCKDPRYVAEMNANQQQEARYLEMAEYYRNQALRYDEAITAYRVRLSEVKNATYLSPLHAEALVLNLNSAIVRMRELQMVLMERSDYYQQQASDLQSARDVRQANCVPATDNFKMYIEFNRYLNKNSGIASVSASLDQDGKSIRVKLICSTGCLLKNWEYFVDVSTDPDTPLRSIQKLGFPNGFKLSPIQISSSTGYIDIPIADAQDELGDFSFAFIQILPQTVYKSQSDGVKLWNPVESEVFLAVVNEVDSSKPVLVEHPQFDYVDDHFVQSAYTTEAGSQFSSFTSTADYSDSVTLAKARFYQPAPSCPNPLVQRPDPQPEASEVDLSAWYAAAEVKQGVEEFVRDENGKVVLDENGAPRTLWNTVLDADHDDNLEASAESSSACNALKNLEQRKGCYLWFQRQWDDAGRCRGGTACAFSPSGQIETPMYAWGASCTSSGDGVCHYELEYLYPTGSSDELTYAPEKPATIYMWGLPDKEQGGRIWKYLWQQWKWKFPTRSTRWIYERASAQYRAGLGAKDEHDLWHERMHTRIYNQYFRFHEKVLNNMDSVFEIMGANKASIPCGDDFGESIEATAAEVYRTLNTLKSRYLSENSGLNEEFHASERIVTSQLRRLQRCAQLAPRDADGVAACEELISERPADPLWELPDAPTLEEIFGD